MKLVFAVDAIFPPLTGIGRYAWELATRLPHYREIEAVKFHALDRWVADPATLLAPAAAGAGFSGGRAVAGLRRWLSQKKLGIRAYSLLTPAWKRWQLRDCSGFIYHSPNFFLPPTPGPAVATVLDLSIYRYPETHPAARRLLFELDFARSLRRAQHLITPSEAVRREVMERYDWPAERITATPLGVSPSFHPRDPDAPAPLLARWKLLPGRYTLCVATIEPRKKIDRLLEAYGLLPEALRRQYPLVLAGGRGWLSHAVHEQIARAEAAGWLKYLGFVGAAELLALYAGARLFAYPSIYEGYGLPVVEAMASGVPVLTSDKSCLPEVAGGAALLVDPDAIDCFRAGLENGLTDETQRRMSRAQGLEVAARATWESCADKTVAVYRRVAATM